MSAEDEVVEFGPFRLEPQEHRLLRGDELMPVTGKAFSTLRVLVQRQGSVVSKRDLMDAVWPNTAVEENSVDRSISTLRKVLGDQDNGESYIETVPRVGYRFTARLKMVSREMAVPERTAIAVLPFADMSPQRDQQYFCEGLAEELINALAQVDGLRVVSRTASFQFRSSGADVQEIGRKLVAGSLVEGSVQKSGDRLRVTVQLIAADTGYHQWSLRFDRSIEDVFAIQDEIAAAVVASLRGSVFNPREKKALERPHTEVAAYEYYLRGRHYQPLRSEDDLKLAVEMFEKAIEVDPKYSPAWAGLAVTHASLYEWFGAKEEDLTAAQRASERALALSPHLAEAHVARGITFHQMHEHDRAAAAFEEALRLAPNHWDALYFYARSRFASGKTEHAEELFKQAAAARHEDFESPNLRVLCLRATGRDAAVIKQAALEAVQRGERALMLNPRNVRCLSLTACVLIDAEQPERALEYARRALELDPHGMSALVNGACLYARLGMKEESIALLAEVFGRGWGHKSWIEKDPDYDSLRDDPRFQQLLANLK
jgi:TolB-like protein/Flp pilus assembly protein TadD